LPLSVFVVVLGVSAGGGEAESGGVSKDVYTGEGASLLGLIATVILSRVAARALPLPLGCLFAGIFGVMCCWR
jgi:hypothetical protein